jgi:hypothetical protein
MIEENSMEISLMEKEIKKIDFDLAELRKNQKEYNKQKIEQTDIQDLKTSLAEAQNILMSYKKSDEYKKI